MISPAQNAAGWNKIIMAGVPSPGVVKITGATRVIGWDVKAAKGQTGASSARKGEPLGKFTASHYLVDDPEFGNDFDEWDAYEALAYSSVRGEDPIALEVIHPDLQRLGWTAAVLGSMGEMMLDGKGGATVKIQWQEHRPPAPKKSSTASKTKAGGGGNPPETAADKAIRDAQEELERLKAEGDELW